MHVIQYRKNVQKLLTYMARTVFKLRFTVLNLNTRKFIYFLLL